MFMSCSYVYVSIFGRTLDSSKLLSCVLYFTLQLQFLLSGHHIPICVSMHVWAHVCLQ